MVARVSSFANEQGRGFDELSLEDYRRFSELFSEDVLSISAESSVAARQVPGGTSFEQVKEAIAVAKASLEGEGGS